MRVIVTVVIVCGAALAAAPAQKSQWDGVYTQEQAQRGDSLYGVHCAGCHGTDLTGGEIAPALAGGEFSSNWNDLSLGDLFERIRVSMPQGNPGSLSRAQKADILAFMLSRGNYPAGESELPSQTEELRTITFLALK
jgi:mono/diheme cytochrome c family protein